MLLMNPKKLSSFSTDTKTPKIIPTTVISDINDTNTSISAPLFYNYIIAKKKSLCKPYLLIHLFPY